MTTTTVNLHDYIVNNKQWEQLWSDDMVAYWIESTDSGQYPYEVFKATHNVLFEDDVMIVSLAHCKDLSQAFDVWNGNINQHLTVKE